MWWRMGYMRKALIYLLLNSFSCKIVKTSEPRGWDLPQIFRCPGSVNSYCSSCQRSTSRCNSWSRLFWLWASCPVKTLLPPEVQNWVLPISDVSWSQLTNSERVKGVEKQPDNDNYKPHIKAGLYKRATYVRTQSWYFNQLLYYLNDY